LSHEDQSIPLEQILEQTLDCIFTFDGKTLEFNYANTGAIQQLGYSKAELLKMKPFDIKPDFSEEEFEGLLAPLIEGRESKLVFQTRHRHRLGHDIPVEISLQYITAPEQESIFVAIVRDISERIQTESELRASEERFRAVANHAPVGIFQTDMEGGCTYVNERWSEITGLSMEQARGHGWLSALHSEDLATVAEHWNKLTLQGQLFELEYRFVRPDQDELWVAGQAMPLNRYGYSSDGYIGTIIDITKTRALEDERRLMERKLQDTQKLESLGLLAGGIAHDFNNLLTSIMGNASLASIEIPENSPAQDHLTRISDGSVRAADLCRQLLAYSGEGHFVVKNLDLNQAIEKTTHLLKTSISKKSVLSVDLYQDLPAIEADPSQINQIIMNLVINASEAIGDASGVINLSTGMAKIDREYLASAIDADELPEGIYAFVEVSDTGSGISNDVLAKIFDPFFTTKYTGRGLGLAAAIGIMRGHKGTIKVYSEIDQGTTFKLLFPVTEGEADTLNDESRIPVIRQRSGRVLIVDDEESIRATVAQMIQKLGLTLELAEDGRQAVELYRANSDSYDLILMDLTMPHMNGEQAYAEMRKINPNTPVILMSGFSKDRTSSRFIGKGLAGFLEKPFTFPTLAELLDKVLASEE
jgi:two-component system cell cycle sensor histidine kinase/response regulator CckA